MKSKVLFFMMFIGALSFAQKKNQVKVYYGFSDAGYSSIKQPEDKIGGCSIRTLGFYINSIGVRYNRKISKHFRFETGLNYFSSNVNVEIDCHCDPPMSCGNTYPKIEKDKIQLLTIPITLIAEIGNYFYINGGFLLDLQVNKPKYLTSQSGIGGVLGIGGKYDYKDFTFFVNPELEIHRLIGFTNEEDTKLDEPEFLGNLGFIAKSL